MAQNRSAVRQGRSLLSVLCKAVMDEIYDKVRRFGKKGPTHENITFSSLSIETSKQTSKRLHEQERIIVKYEYVKDCVCL
jgi:hypothetical protein